MNARRKAEIALALVDAEVAHLYVEDGQLSKNPLNGRLSPCGRKLRKRRKAAVRALEAAGGADPFPSVLDEPTELQRQGRKKRNEALMLGPTEQRKREAAKLGAGVEGDRIGT